MLTRLLLVVASVVAFASSVAAQANAAEIYAVPRPAGGTFIYIKGEIYTGDQQQFASLQPVAPVYVVPSGPGGNVRAALAISDMIWQRGYNTLIGNGYMCASACALIWASGYSHHAIAHNNSILRFHSCASDNQDDIGCDVMIGKHLMMYGFTRRQAVAMLATPHQSTLLGTKPLAALLGFRWQWLPWGFGVADRCMARLCIIVP